MICCLCLSTLKYQLHTSNLAWNIGLSKTWLVESIFDDTRPKNFIAWHRNWNGKSSIAIILFWYFFSGKSNDKILKKGGFPERNCLLIYHFVVIWSCLAMPDQCHSICYLYTKNQLADLVTFTEEIFNGKLQFSCSVIEILNF